MDAPAGGREPKHLDRPALWRKVAQQELCERGLATLVGTKNTKSLALAQREAHIFNLRLAWLVAESHVVDL